MDSVNKNQPEENHADLLGPAAVERIKTILKHASSCFFCTQIPLGPTGGTRPMSVQKIDDDGTLWFLSAIDSHKNEEIAQNPAVTLYFQGSAHSDFMVLEGRCAISRDKAMIKELWEPIVKTWFTGGMDDPRITVVRFVPGSGYYWDTKHGSAIAGIKMLIGAAIGKTLDDSIEGTLKP